MFLQKPRTFDTRHISIDKDECIACWECIESCPYNVINKRDFIVSKYSYVKLKDNCIGCFECAAICPTSAITRKSASV